jgi:hypothetical protein
MMTAGGIVDSIEHAQGWVRNAKPRPKRLQAEGYMATRKRTDDSPKATKYPNAPQLERLVLQLSIRTEAD